MVECEIRNGHPWSIGCKYPDPRQWGEDAALLSDLSHEEQQIVSDWIFAKIRKIKSPNYDHDSYNLKHILENDTGLYITNNQMKDAMLQEGYQPIKVNAINWNFCISNRSPAFKNR